MRNENLLLKAGLYPHEKEKIGHGPQLIKTDRGWLLIYHAVGEIDINICKAYGLSKKIERGIPSLPLFWIWKTPEMLFAEPKTPPTFLLPLTNYTAMRNIQWMCLLLCFPWVP